MKDFLLDRLTYSILFFSNSFFLYLFFKLSTGYETEILYPAAISIFIYIIAMLLEWFKYASFNRQISYCAENPHYHLHTSTREQARVMKVIDAIHLRYINSIKLHENETLQQKHFLSQWIHNLKTPLSAMDMILQKSSAGQCEFQNALKIIGEEKDRVLSSVEQILHIIRLEDFARDYTPEAVNLAKQLRKIINERKNQFIYSNVFPKLSAAAEVSVLTDSKWNEVMLEQLVSNAVKYSFAQEKSKNIWIYLEQKSGSVELIIKDEGIGIPEYDLKRVFQPFFTGKNGRKLKNATGIGLYIADTIARKLGHGIKISSQVGSGTEVRITYLSKL